MINGHLDIQVDNCEDTFEGKAESWQEVLIHGDPKGLKSLANLLLQIAETNQNELIELPIGAKFHTQLLPNLDLSKNSTKVIVGRLDAKGTGLFYDNFISRDI